MIICGIDPGLSGGIVLMEQSKLLNFSVMPLNTNKEVCFLKFREVLGDFNPDHIFLERAVPMAMGSKHAFNYGRGFAALEIAIQQSGKPVTYVEPAKWSKEIHEGISKDLKAKAKSVIAFERLFPQLKERVPKSKTGKYHEGILDALLIASYGVRKLSTLE